MNNDKIAVILPAYNEEKTIVQTLRDFRQELPGAQLVVIDNNSADCTAELVRGYFEENNIGNGVLLTETRQGKAYAIRQAFQKIDAEIYLMADADLTYPAKDAFKLIQQVTSGHADMVVGDRHFQGRYKSQNTRNFHNLGNVLVKTMVNRLFKANLSDILSGYRALTRNFVKNFPVLSDGFQLEVEVTLHALDKRLRIVEVPIEYLPRPSDSFSKLNTFRDGYKVLSSIFRIYRQYRPLAFFGFLSGLLFIGGFVVAQEVFIDWFKYQYIYHLPSAVLATALELLAGVFFAIGLILNAISEKNRFDFELALLRE